MTFLGKCQKFRKEACLGLALGLLNINATFGVLNTNAAVALLNINAALGLLNKI